MEISKKRHILPLALASLLISMLLVACGDDGDSPAPATATPTRRTAPDTPETTAVPSVVATAAATGPPTVSVPALRLQVVNVVSGESRSLPVGFPGLGRDVAWSRDSRELAVAGVGLDAGMIDGGPFSRLWPSNCFDVEWSPTQDLLAAACADGLVVLDSGGRQLATDLVAPLSWAGLSPWLHWSPDGHTIAYGVANAPIQLLQNDGGRDVIAGSFNGGQWLSDGRLASIEQADYRSPATIRIHDPARNFEEVTSVMTPAAPYAIAIGRDGRSVAYAVYGEAQAASRILPSTVVIADLATGKTVASFAAYGSNYGPGSFSPDGSSLVVQTDVCGADWSLGLASLTGTIRTLARGGVMHAKVSPDGSLVGFTRGTELWVVASDGGSPARRLAEGVHGPAGFDWSPDSQTISYQPFFGGFDQCP
ncbi:MAG: hypothetical protein ABI577_08235 [bacterium]